MLVAVVSWVGYLPRRFSLPPYIFYELTKTQVFISGSFMPSIPVIARDLNTTESVIGLAANFCITWSFYFKKKVEWLLLFLFLLPLLGP